MREIRKYSGLNNNENRAYRNLWDVAKEVLRGKFRVGIKCLLFERDTILKSII